MAISHGHNNFVYNDYVPELEADDLISAVKLKQNMYDEGMAKVQEYYDQMSTLPLIRDVDKQYMNNQLNQIFDVIEKNAGSADFSNPQTVRSFLKVAKPLESDPVLKSALSSSEEYTKRLETMQKIKEEHPEKYSEANEWEYLKDLSEWANGTNPGEKLSTKSYMPYVDNSKHYAEMIGKLKAQVDVEFQEMSKSGLIATNEITSLKQNRIKELLLTTMTPQMQAQMDIDARYNTSQLSNEQKYQTVVSKYEDIINRNMTLAKVKGIENETGMTAQEYIAEASAASEILGSLRDPNGYINRNALDQLFTNLYISDWAEGMGKAYEYKQTKANLTQNPMQMQRVKDAAAMSRLNKTLEAQKEIAKIKASAKSTKVTTPTIFDKSTNSARMEDLKSGKIKNIPMNGEQYLSNTDKGFQLRIEAAAAKHFGLTLKDGALADSNKITKFNIKRVGNALKYEMEFSNKPGETFTLDEATLGTQLENYFNSTETVDETPGFESTMPPQENTENLSTNNITQTTPQSNTTTLTSEELDALLNIAK